MRRANVLLALLLFAASARADVLHLKNGTKLEGKILGEEGDVVPFKLNAGGQIEVKRSDIEWFEWSDKAALKAELEKRRKPGTADALAAAGKWALEHGMKQEAEFAFLDALKKDPQNTAANEALGRKQWLGKWVTEDEYMEKTGHVKAGGRWVTVDEKAKLDEGWEWVEGKLVSPDDAKRARGLVEFEGKWITKKEYEAILKKRGPVGGGGDKPPVEPGAVDKKRFHNAKEDAQILKVYAGWRCYSGERYRLITNCDDKDAEFDRKYVESMDAFWPTYCDTFDKKAEQKKLFNIVVHPNQKAYDEWCGKNAPGGIGAFGTYLHGMQFSPAVLWHRDDLRTTLYTGRHECGHQFVANYVRGDGGPWFQEGIAAMFEPDIPYHHYPYRWDFIRGQVIDGKNDITIEDLIKKSASLDGNQNYSRGAATHLFFFTYKDGVYRKQYQQFITKGSISSPKALSEAMGKPLADLEKEYREWVRECDKIREKEGFAPIPPGPK